MPVAIVTDLGIDALPGGIFSFVAKGIALPKQVKVGTVTFVDYNKVDQVTLVDQDAVGTVTLVDQYKIGEVEFVC